MTHLIVCLVAFLGSALTLFSGFGLGTLLTPVFALFFPIELAVGMTAIVHLSNNFFKLALMGKYAVRDVVWRFGIPSVLAAFLGAYVLRELIDFQPIGSYILRGRQVDISPIKLVLGIALLLFALWESLPFFTRLSFDTRYLPIGGALSGFFGGLSGNQGALRTAFLSRLSLSKEAFIGTGVCIACLIDTARLTVYIPHLQTYGNRVDGFLVGLASVASFAGVFIGSRLLQKVTIGFVQKIVAGCLILFALLLMLGIL
jgi:hypothetical protein